MPERKTKRGAERTPLEGRWDVVVCGASFAGLTVDVAGRLYGFNGAEQKAVRHGWSEVGIKVRR